MLTGFPRIFESLDFFFKFQALKVLENGVGP